MFRVNIISLLSFTKILYFLLRGPRSSNTELDRRTTTPSAPMANTEKDETQLAAARQLSHVPWCEQYERMISGMLYVERGNFKLIPDINALKADGTFQLQLFHTRAGKRTLPCAEMVSRLQCPLPIRTRGQRRDSPCPSSGSTQANHWEGGRGSLSRASILPGLRLQCHYWRSLLLRLQLHHPRLRFGDNVSFLRCSQSVSMELTCQF